MMWNSSAATGRIGVLAGRQPRRIGGSRDVVDASKVGGMRFALWLSLPVSTFEPREV